MDNRIMEILEMLSYKRYELENNRDSNMYIYPVIAPLLECKSKKIKKQPVFFDQSMYPIVRKNNHDNYTIEEIQDAMVVGVHGLTKYEYESPYKFHRAVPSARGLHPCEIYIASDKGMKRFNPINENYEFLTEEVDVKEDDFIFIIAADEWRLGKFYGDFAYVLSALDAGHIIGQINALAAKCGCYLDIDYEMDPVLHKQTKGYFKQYGMTVFACIKISNKDDKSDYSPSIGEITAQRQISYTECYEKMKYRNEIIKLRNASNSKLKERRIAPFEIRESEASNSQQSLSYILQNRSSAHSHIGLMSLDSISDVMKSVDWIAKELTSYLEYSNIEDYVDVYMYLNQVNEEMKRAYYVIDKKEAVWKMVCMAEDEKSEWFRIIHDSHEFLNVESIPIVCFVSVNIEKLIQEYDNHLIDVMYMMSGEVSQIICLLATRFGWFCRPIKNIREEQIENALCINTKSNRITYAMLIGNENIKQDVVYFNPYGRS